MDLLIVTLASLVAGFVDSIVGGGGLVLVTQVSPDYLRKALPLILLVVLLHTVLKKELGRKHAPRFAGRRQALRMLALILKTGYDAFLH